MAFIKNTPSTSDEHITSAEIKVIKDTYKAKTEEYSQVNESPIKCDKVKCQFNIEDSICSLDFCFYDETEWKPNKDTFKFKCELCDTETTGDTKNPDMRICDHCKKRFKEMNTLKNCRICGGGMDPKTIMLWSSGICDKCAVNIRKAIEFMHQH